MRPTTMGACPISRAQITVAFPVWSTGPQRGLWAHDSQGHSATGRRIQRGIGLTPCSDSLSLSRWPTFLFKVFGTGYSVAGYIPQREEIVKPGIGSKVGGGSVGRRLDHETHEMARKTRNPFVLFVLFASFVLQTPFRPPATILSIAAPYCASLFGPIPLIWPNWASSRGLEAVTARRKEPCATSPAPGRCSTCPANPRAVEPILRCVFCRHDRHPIPGNWVTHRMEPDHGHPSKTWAGCRDDSRGVGKLRRGWRSACRMGILVT